MPVLGSGLSAYTVLAAGGSSNWTSVMPQPWLAAAGGVCAIAALVWARAAARLAQRGAADRGGNARFRDQFRGGQPGSQRV